VSGSDTRDHSREYPHIARAHAGYLLIVLRTDAIRDVPDHGPLVTTVRFIAHAGYMVRERSCARRGAPIHTTRWLMRATC
jgi:hypothetical protein